MKSNQILACPISVYSITTDTTHHARLTCLSKGRVYRISGQTIPLQPTQHSPGPKGLEKNNEHDLSEVSVKVRKKRNKATIEEISKGKKKKKEGEGMVQVC